VSSNTVAGSSPQTGFFTAKRIKVALLVVVAIAITLFPLSPSVSAQNTVILALIFAIAASGLNVITGYTGYLSLTHGAFLGVGAYTAAILGRANPDVSPFVWVPLAGIIAAVMAALLGLVTYRSRGASFVIITIAFLFLTQFVATNWVDLTNGTAGITFPLPDWDIALGNRPFNPVLVGLLAI